MFFKEFTDEQLLEVRLTFHTIYDYWITSEDSHELEGWVSAKIHSDNKNITINNITYLPIIKFRDHTRTDLQYLYYVVVNSTTIRIYGYEVERLLNGDKMFISGNILNPESENNVH